MTDPPLFKNLFLPTDNELDRRFREERAKRRQIRLNQVQEQSKSIAAEIREKAQQEKAMRIVRRKQKLKVKMEREKENRIQALQKMEQQCLDEVGGSHHQALTQPNLEEKKKQDLEQFCLQAAERGKKALSALQSIEGETDWQNCLHHSSNTSAWKKTNSFPNSTVKIPGKDKGTSKTVSGRREPETSPIPAQPNIKDYVHFAVEKNLTGIESKDSWHTASEDILHEEQIAQKKSCQIQEPDRKAKESLSRHSTVKVYAAAPEIGIGSQEQTSQAQSKRFVKRTTENQKYTQQEDSYELMSHWSKAEVQKQKKLEQEVENILDMLIVRNEKTTTLALETASACKGVPNIFEPKVPEGTESLRDIPYQYKDFSEEQQFYTPSKKNEQTNVRMHPVGSDAHHGTEHLPGGRMADACTETDQPDWHDAFPLSEISSRSSETNYLQLPSVLRHHALLSSVSENLQKIGVASPHTVEKFVKLYRSHFFSTLPGMQQPDGTTPLPSTPANKSDNASRTPFLEPIPIPSPSTAQINTQPEIPPAVHPEEAITMLQKKLQGEVRQKVFPVPPDEDDLKFSSSSKRSKSSSLDWNELLSLTLDMEDLRDTSPRMLEWEAATPGYYFPEVVSSEAEQGRKDANTDSLDIISMPLNGQLSRVPLARESLSTSDSHVGSLSKERAESIRAIVEKQIQELSLVTPPSTSSSAASDVVANMAGTKRKPPVTVGRLVSDEFVPHELSVIEEKDSLANQTQETTAEFQNSSRNNRWTEGMDRNSTSANRNETIFMDLTCYSNNRKNKVDSSSSPSDSSREDASEKLTYLSSHTPNTSKFTCLSGHTPGGSSEHSKSEASVWQTPKQVGSAVVDGRDHLRKSNSKVDSTPSSTGMIETPSVSPASYQTALPTPSLPSDEGSYNKEVAGENFWTDVIRQVNERTKSKEKICSDIGSVKSLQTHLVLGQSTPIQSRHEDFENGILEEPVISLVDIDSSTSELESRSEDLNRTLTEVEASMLSHLDDLIEKKHYLADVAKPSPGEPSLSDSLMSFLLNEMSIAASISSLEPQRNDN